ncbi:sulfatase-like hydrolase/transferase [Paenibacillus allorhizosphaerae]|uniref:Ulvan-active sulfatase n=1 Tax=Paenibacillus allorhizosphaerae TaxID=2849866 RepID=A0ABM8VD77_9BACL|nr:sulfatase-like hydrolase/transferase [Paenibacillus allorhizosphaerae]CAG7626566.1 Ulvan-active sulfatase [Paenibacillus allorhizosphaerae]
MRILLLDLDSLRPDHLGCYGYHRNTSPHIDQVAEQGVTFTNYYTSDAPCFPSRTALMTGRFGIHNGVVGHGGTAADVRHDGPERKFRDLTGRECLPMLLRNAGFKTSLISPFAERHAAWTFNAGFNEIFNTGLGGMESAEVVTPVVTEWIRNNAAQDNWFLYVNYWDAHTPYRAPLSYGNPFENDPLPAWITAEVLERHKQKVGPHSASEINMYNNRTLPKFPRHPGEIKDESGLRQMIDGYDTAIRYIDDQIGAIFALLEEAGVMDEVAIIITADHGENQGELGIYGEHGTADQGTCRIPMIIRWPGAEQGHVDHGLHYHLDLGPTLAELFQRPPMKSWDGQSYAPAILEGKECGREALVVSQCAHVCQRSVRFGDWLYIRTYHDGYHLFDKEMLFNIKEDPHEQVNLAQERRDVCMEAVYRLNDWHDDMMNSMKHDVDPLWTVMKEGGPFHAKGHLKKYAEWLEASGRGHAIEELARRHPAEWA